MLVGINVITILNPFLFILPDFIANKIEVYVLLLEMMKSLVKLMFLTFIMEVYFYFLTL